MKRKSFIIGILIVLIFSISLSCAAPFTPQGAGALQQTQGALAFQATGLALQAQQATLDAAKAGGSSQAPSAPTFTPLPTFTLAAPSQPQAVDAGAPTKAPTQSAADMKARIKKSNVLVFEDIWDTPLSGNRRVSMAVDQMAFSGGRVINTGDAYGDFKANMTGSTKWDLIVVSGEAHEGIKGEFYDYLSDQAQRGTGVIVELWNMDSIVNGKIQNLIQPCGISYQKNWVREWGYDKDDQSLIVLDPSNPVFNNPRANISLAVPTTYWAPAAPGEIVDGGDFMKLSSGGDGKLLMGMYQSHKSDYGVLASCFEDRVFIQTFCTHDYRQSETVNLWVNMMTNALINHYKYIDGQPK